jgi:hypothetical protein
MLKAIQRKVVRLAMAVAVIWLLAGPPIVDSPSTVLQVFASECQAAGGGGC